MAIIRNSQGQAVIRTSADAFKLLDDIEVRYEQLWTEVQTLNVGNYKSMLRWYWDGLTGKGWDARA